MYAVRRSTFRAHNADKLGIPEPSVHRLVHTGCSNAGAPRSPFVDKQLGSTVDGDHNVNKGTLVYADGHPNPGLGLFNKLLGFLGGKSFYFY